MYGYLVSYVPRIPSQIGRVRWAESDGPRGTKMAFLPVRGVPYEPGVYLQSQQKHAILGHGGKVTQMSFRGVPSSRYGGDGSD